MGPEDTETGKLRPQPAVKLQPLPEDIPLDKSCVELNSKVVS